MIDRARPRDLAELQGFANVAGDLTLPRQVATTRHGLALEQPVLALFAFAGKPHGREGKDAYAQRDVDAFVDGRLGVPPVHLGIPVHAEAMEPRMDS